MAILLTNIQRFSLHDGPGIRTTVFLKGCSLQCPWCSNPENIRSYPQNYLKDGAKGVYGQYMTAEELLSVLVKDENYYSGELEQDQWNITDAPLLKMLPGGITFSGGEPLLQISELEPVIRKLQEKKIHTTVESCLYISTDQLKKAIELIDLFYVDLKIMDPISCKTILNGEVSVFKRNLDILMNACRPVVFRIPVIGQYTDGEDNQKQVCELLKKYHQKSEEGCSNLLKAELIREHNLGEDKYRALSAADDSYRIPAYYGVTDEQMDAYREKLRQLVPGLEVGVNKI